MKKYFFFIFFFLNTYQSFCFEISTIATVNNQPISNIDLMLEVKSLEIINNEKINKKAYQTILSNLINDKIKDIETQNQKINFNKEEVDVRFNKIIEGINKNIKVNNGIKKKIKKKIEISLKWQNLIRSNFRNKININMSEIEQKIKYNKLSQKEIENYRIIEKNKKINVLSRTYFNEIKRKYLIKIY